MAHRNRAAEFNMTKPIVKVVKVGVRKSESKCMVKMSVKIRGEKLMVEKLVQKWKPKDNVCFLFALWGMMSIEQRMLAIMDGKKLWPREIFAFCFSLTGNIMEAIASLRVLESSQETGRTSYLKKVTTSVPIQDYCHFR